MWEVLILEITFDQAAISFEAQRQKLHKASSDAIDESPDVAE